MMIDKIYPVKTQIGLPMPQIVDFCHRWKITEFALFGSVLRDDFRPDSDVDVLVTFAPDSRWSLFDVLHMKYELEENIFGRKVDISEKSAVEASPNYITRKAILNSAQVIYP